MIYQTKLTDPLNLKKFKKLGIKVITGSELKFFVDTFILGHPVYSESLEKTLPDVIYPENLRSSG